VRRLTLALAVLALGLAAPSFAQDVDAISLVPEEAVLVHLDADGNSVGPRERSRAEWTPFDLAVARHAAGLPSVQESVPVATPMMRDSDLPAPRLILPSALRVRFMMIAGQHSVLILENGYDRALVFRARMTRGGETRSTDVCLVPANQRSFEHWPHPIERIDLDAFRFVAWQPGGPPPCA